MNSELPTLTPLATRIRTIFDSLVFLVANSPVRDVASFCRSMMQRSQTYSKRGHHFVMLYNKVT